MKALTLKWTLAVGCALFGAGALAQTTTASKPFFSRAIEKSYRSVQEYTELPDKTGLATLWYDIPFVVNVPVEVPYEGGTVRITMTGTVKWDDPPKEWTSSSRWGDTTGWTAGMYRMDGEPLAADSVFNQFDVLREERSSWRKIEFAKDNPVPTYFTRERVTLSNVEKMHVPFSRDATRYSYLLAPAKPGWYVVWFALDLSTMWPQKATKRDEIKGRFHIDTVVTRGERVLIQDDYEYLFKRSQKPAQISDSKLFKISSHEVPFTLKRNGWILESAEIQNLENWVDKKRVTKDARDFDVEVDVKRGPPAVLALRVSEWGEAIAGREAAPAPNYPKGFDPKTRSLTSPGATQNAQPATITAKETFQWSFDLPKEIPDHGFGVIKVSGGTERWVNREHTRYKDTPPGKEPQLSLRVRWQPMTTSGALFNAAATGVYTDRQRRKEAIDSMRKAFLQKHGDDALTWWFEDYRPETFDGPTKGGEPFRYLAHGVPPLWDRDLFTGKKKGAVPILAFEAGPWKVLGLYRRFSDTQERAGSSTAPGTVALVNEKDPFWTAWFDTYAQLEEKMVADVRVAEQRAGSEALVLRVALRRHRLLMDTLKHELSEQGGNQELRVLLHQATASIAKLKELATAQSAIIDMQRKKIEAIAAEAKAAFEAIVKKLDEGWQDYGDRHFELRLWRQHYQDKADRIALEILRKVGDRDVLRKYLEEAATTALSASNQLLRAELLRTDGNFVDALEALRSAARIAPDDKEVQARLSEGECVFLQIAKEKSQDTIKQARAAFYDYMTRRGFQMEKTAEQRKAEAAAAKANAEAEETSTFWWAWGKLPDIDSETAWNVFTTGLFGAVAGIMDKPNELAGILSTVETEMTKSYLGLETLIRLRQLGHPLMKPERAAPLRAGRPDETKPWIGDLTSQQILAAIPLRNLRSDLFTGERAEEVIRCVRLALRLPEVQALMSGDQIALKLGVERRYWNPNDIGDAWIEYIGDITSVQNLVFMFLPMATAGKVPGAIYWGAEELWQVEKARQFGHVMTGSEAAARMLGWQKLVTTLGKWEPGREAVLALLKGYEEHHRAKEWWEKGARLGLLDKGIWGFSQLMGMMYFQYHVSEWAKERGGPAAALAADFLMFFATDVEALTKFLKQSRMSPAAIKALQTVMKDRVMQLQASARHIRESLQLTDDLGKVLAKMREGKVLTPDEIRIFERESARYWQARTPAAHPSHNLRLALDALAEGAQNGVDNGAGVAAAKISARMFLEEKSLEEADAAAKKVMAGLDQAQAESAAAAPAAAIAAAAEAPPTPGTWKPFKLKSDGKFTFPTTREPKPGSLCAQAVAAMNAGDLEGAEKLLESAKKKVLNDLGRQVEELPVDQIEMTLGLVAGLKKTKKLPPGAKSAAIAKDIPPDEFTRVLDEFFAPGGPWKEMGHHGAYGAIHRKPGSDFIIKEIKDDVLEQLEGEAVARSLLKSLGIDSPGLAIHLVHDAAGNVERAIVVYRNIPGRRLDELTPAEIFLLKDELSKLRAVSLTLGDFDRKLDNFMVTDDGRLFAIDHGWADTRGKRNILAADNITPGEQPRMEGAFGLDHWYSLLFRDDIKMLANKRNVSGLPKRNLVGADPLEVFCRKQLVMEQALTHSAAKSTIDRIEQLVADEKELRKVLDEAYRSVYGSEARLKQRTARVTRAAQDYGTPMDEAAALARAKVDIEMEIGTCVNEAVATIKQRVEKGRLDTAMQHLNQRQGLPGPTLPRPTAALDLRLVPVVRGWRPSGLSTFALAA